MEQKQRTKRQRVCTASSQQSSPSSPDDELSALLKLIKSNNKTTKVIVFTGSGISVSAGLSTFSKGLYVKAAKRFKLKDGKELFRYRFLKEKPEECFAFFSDLHKETKKAKPTISHQKLQEMGNDCSSPLLIRHYTMNIDGLATVPTTRSPSSRIIVSAPWHPQDNPEGKTVELHGNLHEWVCRRCQIHSHIPEISKGKRKKSVRCEKCGGLLRFRVLLYDDEEGHLIHNYFHPQHTKINPLDEMLRQDLEQSDIILWIGISFEQSASCENFRKVWEMLHENQKENKKKMPPCFIVNPEASNALFHLQTAVGSLLGETKDGHGLVYTIHSSSDGFFEKFLGSNSNHTLP